MRGHKLLGLGFVLSGALLAWFQRAVKLHDGDANLEIAKIYIQMNEEAQAVHYLKQTCDARRTDVTEYSQEEAKRLLKQMGRA